MEGNYAIPSPAFTTRPPVVRNAGLIPADIRAAMHPALGTRAHGPGSVTMHDLRDVYVIGEGLVFDRNLQLAPPSVTQHSPAEIEGARMRLGAALAAGPIEQHAGRTVLCIKRGASNYGHWLAEMLPVAALCLPAIQAGACRALFPDGPLGRVPADSLAMLGVPHAQLLPHDGTPQSFARLTVAEGLTWHGHHLSPLVIGALDRMAAGVPAGLAAKVWVSRAKLARTLWREADLEAMLSAQGWTVARPGGMALCDQIALFKGARHIAGVTGAGLTNLVFASPPARVTAFMPAGMPDTFYWLLSELRGHDYTEVRCVQGGTPTGPAPWDVALVEHLPSILSHL